MIEKQKFVIRYAIYGMVFGCLLGFYLDFVFLVGILFYGKYQVDLFSTFEGFVFCFKHIFMLLVYTGLGFVIGFLVDKYLIKANKSSLPSVIDKELKNIPKTKKSFLALIQCPACKTEISNQAASCPKCGHPMVVTQPPSEDTNSKPNLNLSNKYGIFGFLFGILLWWGGCLGFRGPRLDTDIPFLIFCALLTGAAFSALGVLIGVANSRNNKGSKE